MKTRSPKSEGRKRKQRACRRCGCTYHEPCIDGRGVSCGWVERDLCSHCLTPRERKVYLDNLNRPKYPLRIVSAPTVPEMCAAIQLTIDTLRDSFVERIGGNKGRITNPAVIVEIEHLVWAQKSLRAR